MKLNENKLLGTDISRRVYGLDILRASAIIFVLLAHIQIFGPPSLGENISFFSLDGVEIFFVLSGYLIGTILIRTFDTKEVNLKVLLNFWGNRWFRTLPPYYFVLLLLFIIAKLFYPHLAVQTYFLSFSQKLDYVFFLQNFNHPHYGFFVESWSLCIEEWFYIFIPIICFILYKVLHKDVKKVFIIALILVVGYGIAYRFMSYQKLLNLPIEEVTFNTFDYVIKKQVVTRLDSIMFGVLGSYLAYYYKSFWIKNTLIWFILGLIILYADHAIGLYRYHGMIPLFQGYWGIYNCIFSSTISSLGVLMLLPYLSSLKKGHGFIYRSMTYLSLISYSLYLLNLSLIYYCIFEPLSRVISFNPYLEIVLYCTVCLVLSTLMYKYIEKPCMDIRKKIFK